MCCDSAGNATRTVPGHIALVTRDVTPARVRLNLVARSPGVVLAAIIATACAIQPDTSWRATWMVSPGDRIQPMAIFRSAPNVEPLVKRAGVWKTVLQANGEPVARCEGLLIYSRDGRGVAALS